MQNLYHFYHVYSKGKWEVPLDDHITALEKYGLLDNLTTFQVGLVGPVETRNDVKKYLDDRNIKYEVCSEADEGWEQVTQNALHKYIQDKDGYVYYAHTKNAVNINDLHIKWRRSMTYYTAVTWQECINQMDNGASAAGSHYLPMSNEDVKTESGFFGGTFWWTHAKYLKNFPLPEQDHRHGAEAWIGYLKRTVEDMNETFIIHDFNPTHPGSNLGMVVNW